MKVKETALKGCFTIQPNVFEDKRGYFFESFNQEKFEEHIGKKIDFVQDNESKSQKGVLRGLHFQIPPYAQAKLVRVVQGEVLDVAVDLRKDSPTFGKHQSVLLTAKNKTQFFMPRGFAHGFLVLSDTAIFSYKIDNVYAPDHDTGIIWNDKDLNIDWQFEKKKLILSEKDKNLQSFKDFKSPF
ncbi:MAG: dTDP-4-dehydrorhamnose 3,5-epimerase [Bacteroidetes bacterium]|jgi:dTDP-4-dehydrorhamnose 3,5-epimerase|nr:dTDP-4-dehydrorhamnose 3,5-epimerase [Bacteroidota bacterium]